MNRVNIVKELDKWAKKEFGLPYSVQDDGDLTLCEDGYCVAWFRNFGTIRFRFASNEDKYSIQLIKKGIIEKFYDKVIELMSKYEPKYTVQVLPSEYGFLYKLKNDLSDLTTSDIGRDCTFSHQWGYFTKSEIEGDDLAVDWDKAIIKEVND